LSIYNHYQITSSRWKCYFKHDFKLYPIMDTTMKQLDDKNFLFSILKFNLRFSLKLIETKIRSMKLLDTWNQMLITIYIIWLVFVLFLLSWLFSESVYLFGIRSLVSLFRIMSIKLLEPH
jgi:hypothetical protein